MLFSSYVMRAKHWYTNTFRYFFNVVICDIPEVVGSFTLKGVHAHVARGRLVYYAEQFFFTAESSVPATGLLARCAHNFKDYFLFQAVRALQELGVGCQVQVKLVSIVHQSFIGAPSAGLMLVRTEPIL